MLSPQLPLNIALNDAATFANFLAEGPSAALLASLQGMLTARQPDGVHSEHSYYLYGAPGAGVSHLLQATCLAALDAGLAALYLPLSVLPAADLQDSLDGLEALDVLCIDDLQCLVGQRAAEEALFHFYNRVHDAGSCLLLGANASPRQLAFVLPDLQSRLNACLVYRLEALDDEQKMRLLKLRAGQRGLQLGDEEARYILHRSGRGTSDLLQVLAQLDRAALAHKRRLTIPFIREVMAW